MENPTALWVSFFIVITLFIFVYIIITISSNRKTKNYGNNSRNNKSEINGIYLAGKNLSNIYYCIFSYLILNGINYLINKVVSDSISNENYDLIINSVELWIEVYDIIQFVLLMILLINIYRASINLKAFSNYYKLNK